MKILDFYTGFEGHPEILILLKNKDDSPFCELKTWIGYFDSTLKKIQPNNGNWEGIALHYHMETGWYDGEWECDNLSQLFRQLLNINKVNLDSKEQQFVEAFFRCSFVCFRKQ
jgi:hypothetical protein